MFPYTTPNTFYPDYPTQNPRDKYLAALAMARQAEEEYLTAEASLEFEEQALRGRLEQLAFEKRRLHGGQAAGRLFALAGVGPTEARSSFAESIDQQNNYHRQGARGATRLATGHRRELEAQRASPHARNVAFIQSAPSFPYAFGSDTILSTGSERSPPFGEDVPMIQFAPALATRVGTPRYHPCAGRTPVKRYSLGLPVPNIAVRQAKAAVSTNNTRTTEAPGLNGIAELLRAQARVDVSTHNSAAGAAAPSAVAEFLRAIHAAEVKTLPVAPSPSAPSSSKSTEVVPELEKSVTEPQQPSHTTVEECLGAMLGHIAQRVEASASPATNTIPGSTPVKTSEVESSLKAELEARLNNDQSNEIKDTIHAIFASLNDAHANSPSSSSKGKEKASPISAPYNVTKDVASSIEAVQNVNAALHTLQSEFVFPVQLDFTSAASPASSDSESSLTGRLAYTSRNAPVRFYEQSLSGLLAQLDSIESFGHEALRKSRKSVVEAVESALEELERDVEGRWRSKTAKEAKVAVEQDAVNTEADFVTFEVAVPAESVKGNQLAPADALTPVEATVVGKDEVVAVDAALETSIATPLPKPTEFFVASEVVSESSASVTEHPLPASDDPSTSAYPPSSASIDTIRPYDVESQSSGDPQESFLLSEDNSAEQETVTKKKVDDDTGSDWSEVEA